MIPKVYADFHNCDPTGRVRLNCVGTLEDLSRQQVQLHEGLVLKLYTDDVDDCGDPDELLVEGTVVYSADERCWVAAIDQKNMHHASDAPVGENSASDRSPSLAPAGSGRKLS
jgi:hypothetical protein